MDRTRPLVARLLTLGAAIALLVVEAAPRIRL
jgi:hypothetical protein